VFSTTHEERETNMVEAKRMRDGVAFITQMIEAGQTSLDARVVQAHLLTPADEMLEAIETVRQFRWLTVTEAINDTDRNRKYFDKRLRSLSGRSRLEMWRDEGLADRTADGIWLLNPVCVASEVDESAPGASVEALNPSPEDPNAGVDALVDDLLTE
jgi:hypothetical protein